MKTTGRGWPAVLGPSLRSGRTAKARRLLRQVIAVLFSVTASLPAQARSWDLIAKSDDDLVTFYIDRTATAVHGSIHHVRLLYDYRSDQLNPDTLIATRSMTTVTDIDCRAGSMAGIEGTGYAGSMASGKTVWDLHPSRESLPPHESAKPGSLDRKVVDYVCRLPVRRGGR